MNQQKLQQMNSEIREKFDRVDEIKKNLEKSIEQNKIKKEFLIKKRE